MASGCNWFHWNNVHYLLPSDEPDHFSLPSPTPEWPQGGGFASGIASLGEIEVRKITQFVSIWGCNLTRRGNNGVTFYRPLRIPEGFHCLGHYCQPNDRPLHGYLLTAREVDGYFQESDHISNIVKLPALVEPLDYTLIWSPDDGSEEKYSECAYIWLPQPPDGYKSMGYFVTNKLEKPEVGEVRCVRADLTDRCETYRLMFNISSKCKNFLVQIWSTRACHRGMLGRGVPVGTFHCGSYEDTEKELPIACLKNLDSTLSTMPNLNQIHALINHYGPTVFFHPKEIYLPSSVSWFFENGVLLHRDGISSGETIHVCGKNLPGGGRNDRGCWMDLPTDGCRDKIIYGNLESAKLYVHVKPALGGTFTDIAMWVFCPFNGPSTLKLGIMNTSLGKIGQHVGDWEHITLRICNFTGELCSIYFSQHSGGEWVDAYNLEFIEGNKAIVYSSKSGHASYPHPGVYIQGSAMLGIGIRNDCARSHLFVDSSIHYEIVAAEYLRCNGIVEPCWLQFMREWGPTIVYSSRTKLDNIIDRLPLKIRCTVANIFRMLPGELFGEGGPTGPKEKNNWEGDERG